LVDAGAIGAAWERALTASQAPWVDRWIHADLMPQNLLVRSGRLSAVLDCDGLCVGDPAVDLMPAWNLFGPRGREVFRDTLGVDDPTWERGRGWAVCQAVVALPYYLGTNDTMVASSLHTLRALGG
jgi:aminoglycoside phosphotransferase (APT) family kinase protein